MTTNKTLRDDQFELYDLEVVVESINGNCTCNMAVGDKFYMKGHCCPVNFEMTVMLKQRLILITLSACLFDRSLSVARIRKPNILDIQFHVSTSCGFIKALLHKTFKRGLFKLAGQQ